jgi:hypothetical protein
MTEEAFKPCRRHDCPRLAVMPADYCCTHCMAPVAGQPHHIECEWRHKAYTKQATP